MDRLLLPVAGLVSGAIRSPPASRPITTDWPSRCPHPFRGWRLRSCVPVDLYSRVICRAKPRIERSSWVETTYPSDWKEQLPMIVSTGLLFASVAAFIVDLGLLLGLPAAAAEFGLSTVSFRGIPTIEENLRQGIKEVSAVVESAVDVIPSQDPTREELEKYRYLINEVWEVVDGNYMDVRSTGFSKEDWAALRDQALAKKLGSEGAAYRAVREMLSTGVRDPYTRFVPEDEFSALQKYDISGVGLNVGTAEDFEKNVGSPLPQGSGASRDGVWVLGLMKNSPADMVGIQQGDRILEIDGKPLDGISPFKAATMMKGENKNANLVDLKVLHPQGSIENLLLNKPSISRPSPVTSNMETVGNRKIGFVKLESFTAGAQEDLVKSLMYFKTQNATELVLDLRDNRGGLVQEGLEVAKIFLDGNSTVVLTDESGLKGQSRVVAPGPPITKLPLTVLVNQKTGSASEILAGAIKDNCRGVLAGSKTYGKGLIQSVYALRDGSGLVLTVGRYLTPAMVDIDREGIQPDFRRIPSAEAQEAVINACKLNRKP